MKNWMKRVGIIATLLLSAVVGPPATAAYAINTVFCTTDNDFFHIHWTYHGPEGSFGADKCWANAGGTEDLTGYINYVCSGNNRGYFYYYDDWSNLQRWNFEKFQCLDLDGYSTSDYIQIY